MKLEKVRNVVLLTGAVFVTGCATAPVTPMVTNLSNQFKQTFASEDPCSNNARNIGIVGGAVLGAILANAIGHKDDAKIVGLALGGALGGFIGADIDRKRCELSKVARQYDLDITFTNIAAQGDASLVVPTEQQDPAINQLTPSIKAAAVVIGNIVAVRDKDGTSSHFDSGSDTLTQHAQDYFSAIAEQYAPETLLAEQADPKRKEELRNHLKQRHILLIGHTDDTGSSQINANLSERRARTVAEFLKQKGVKDVTFFYQGAGETYPIADNKTEEGRSANRRVEIVEVNDAAGFKNYLENRKPNLAYYRPVQSQSIAASIEVTTKKTSQDTKVAAAKEPTKPAKENQPSTVATVLAVIEDKSLSEIDFGGHLANGRFKVVDIGTIAPKNGFSIISTVHADELPMVSCAQDRPRIRGDVKSLSDGKTYKMSEYLPGARHTAWGGQVNGHYVGLTNVTVLRNGGKSDEMPTLMIYKNWQPGSKQSAEIKTHAEVNAYQGEKAILFRAFPVVGPVRCIDMVIAKATPYAAPESNLVYQLGGALYQANYAPTIAR